MRDGGLYGKAEGKVSSVSQGSKPVGELESLPSRLLYGSVTRESESLRKTSINPSRMSPARRFAFDLFDLLGQGRTPRLGRKESICPNR